MKTVLLVILSLTAFGCATTARQDQLHTQQPDIITAPSTYSGVAEGLKQANLCQGDVVFQAVSSNSGEKYRFTCKWKTSVPNVSDFLATD